MKRYRDSRVWAVGLACAGLAILHYLASRRLAVGVFNDDAFFILLAKALRSGAFSLPDGTPVTDPLPGFPALLMVPAWLVEPRWGLLKPLMLACAAASVFLSWKLARRFLPEGWAAAAALIVGLNPVLTGLDGIVTPDIPLLALALALFLGAGTLERGKGLAQGIPLARSLPALAGLAAGAGLAALMRPQGAFLALSLGLTVWARAGAGAGLSFTAVALAPLAAWMARNILVGRTVTGYVSNWRSQFFLFAEPGQQARHFVDLAGSLFGQGLAGVAGPPALAAAAGMLCLALAGLGAARLAKEREGALAAGMASYVILILALHATWPLTEARYLIPILPFVVIFTLAAGRTWLDRRPRTALLLLCAQALVLLRYDLAFASRGAGPEPRFQPETMAWIAGHIPEDARVESLSFHCVELFAGRRAVPPGLTVYDRDAWLESALVRGVGYVHASNAYSTGEFSYPSLPYLKEPRLDSWARSTPYAEQVYSNPGEGTGVFRIAHPDPARFLRAFSACLKADGPDAPGQSKTLARELKEALRLEPSLECAARALADRKP